jgi:hypothetical protein
MLPLLTQLDDKVRSARERADALKATYDCQVAAASTPPVGAAQDHIMDRGTVDPFVPWFAPLDETIHTDWNLPFLIRLDNEVRTALERADELKVAYDRQVAEDARQGFCNWGAHNAAWDAYHAATQSLASAMAHRREVWRDRWEGQLPRTRQAYDGACDSLGNAIEERRDAWEKRSLRRTNQSISRIGRALLLLVL